MKQVTRRIGGALVVAACLVATSALPALAHAQLERSTPTDNETVAVAPTEVTVTFNEPVTAPVAALRVFDTNGSRVDSGSFESSGAGFTTMLDDDLPNGTYIATWRAVSEDGHPISGAFVFHVGEPGAQVDETLIASLLGTNRGHAAALAAGVARWLSYLTSLVAIGAFVFASGLDADARARAVRVVRPAAWLGLAASVIQVPLFAVASTGLGVAALGSSAAWRDALASSVGFAAVARILGLALMLAALPRWRNWLGWLSVSLLVGAELVTGHTRTTEPVWLILPAAATHVLSAGVWLGGLIMLVGIIRETPPSGRSSAVAQFSRLATVTVLALVLGGLVLSWTQVRTLDALLSTTYGWTLIAKVALAAVVLALAFYNNRNLVPRVTGDTEEPKPWQSLGRSVRTEIAGLVLVLGVTAFLVNLQPAAEAAGVFGPFSTYVDLGDREINILVEPNRAGENTVHGTVYSTAGLPARIEGPVTFEFSLPSQEIGPIVREPRFAGPNHVIHTGSELTVPGRWQIIVREQVSEFEENVAVVEVTVTR